jgi:hypothetical protein
MKETVSKQFVLNNSIKEEEIAGIFDRQDIRIDTI